MKYHSFYLAAKSSISPSASFPQIWKYFFKELTAHIFVFHAFWSNLYHIGFTQRRDMLLVWPSSKSTQLVLVYIPNLPSLIFSRFIFQQTCAFQNWRTVCYIIKSVLWSSFHLLYGECHYQTNSSRSNGIFHAS